MGLLARSLLAHRGWRYRTRVDPDEIRWMRSALREGDSAVDVGAYKGGYTYWMRREVGDAGEVLAIEPQPGLARYLRRCALDFGWDNVHVAEVAASSRRGTATLRLPAGEPSPAASLVGASLRGDTLGYEVGTDTLDSLLAEHHLDESDVRLIKCDVEGHELDVFRGAVDTLARHRPYLLFECEARHLEGHTMQDVFEHLARLGYRGAFFWHGSLVDVDDFDADVHQVEGRRPYANNFVFTHGRSPLS